MRMLTSDEANATIAFFALIIACLSVYFSLRALKIQQKHNELSVKPIPFIGLSDLQDRLIITFNNHGFGPLIVKSFEIIGSEIQSYNLSDCVDNPPQEIIKGIFTTIFPNRSVPAEGDVDIMNVWIHKDEKVAREYMNDCRESLSKLSLKISYTDIYGNNFKQYEKTLIWFGKNRDNS
jgi:hypothetical protein